MSAMQSGRLAETASDPFYLTILDADGWVWAQSWDSERICDIKTLTTKDTKVHEGNPAGILFPR